MLFFLISFFNLGLGFMGFRLAAWYPTNPEFARIYRLHQAIEGEGQEMVLVGEQEKEEREGEMGGNTQRERERLRERGRIEGSESSDGNVFFVYGREWSRARAGWDCNRHS